MVSSPAASTTPPPDSSSTTPPVGDGSAADASAGSGNTDGASDTSGRSETTPVELVGLQRTLSASAEVSVDGLAAKPTAAAPADAAPGGRHYYIDANSGDDANNGLAAAASGSGVGPWKTLARAMQSSLGPGDALVLACGSQWRETLRVPASGTADRPLVVTAPSAGCSSPPVIDGSITLQPQDWTLDRGNIYRAPLSSTPLQVLPSSGILAEAHHPNRGTQADPTSTYLALAADGNLVTSGSRQGSTVLVTGSDLVLPTGARLDSTTRVRVRTNSWTLEEASVSGSSGNTLTLNSATRYPALAGWGYYLLGQSWMLDSAGEWFHDATTQRLYAWMPDSAAPAAPVYATVLASGADFSGRSHVVVNGLAIRRVGVGVLMRQSTGVKLRNLSLVDIAGIGVDAAASTAAEVESTLIVRTGSDAISGQADTGAVSSGMLVRNNILQSIAVLMNAESMLSLPVRSRAAIIAGTGATITGNAVLDAGYTGIAAAQGSLVSNNFIFGACSVLDDGGGIYASRAGNGSTITGNTVVHMRGNVQGKPASVARTQAQGIYLDESASGVTVQDNTVIDADNGIQLHVASANVLRANRLYGNRRAQLWMQETRNTDNANGDLFANVIDGNSFAPVTTGSVGVHLQTKFASTAGFGSFDNNRHLDRLGAVALVETATVQRNYTFTQWQQASGVGSATPLDRHGAAVSNSPYAAFSVTGANLIPNASLASNALGWAAWNQTAPTGQLIREACPVGVCLRYLAGGSPGIVSSPNFSVQQGQWYRLSIDLSTQTENQEVQVVVRRGGGGNNGYEPLSASTMGQRAGTAWNRYSAIFQATKTVNVRDPLTGDLGARVDVQGIDVGHSVSLANMELVPVTPDGLALFSAAVLNAGPSSLSAACPFAGSQPTLCGMLRRLSDDSRIAWPLTVPPYNAVLIYAQQDALLDSDRDGIADSQDVCTATSVGSGVNAAGCPLQTP